MKKPAAYRASVLVLLVLIQTGGSISIVEAADQHEQVCIPPAANGLYNVAYNNVSLLVQKPAEVQDLVLQHTNDYLTRGFKKGPDEFCPKGRHYVVLKGGYPILLFSYGYCGEGIDRQRCSDCLHGAAQVIKQFCPDSCSGAQASSSDCCVRFEHDPFCQDS
ncbi:hypothetical protein LINGRAHAP2_LOCUS12157 [Linum grandiflorum]